MQPSPESLTAKARRGSRERSEASDLNYREYLTVSYLRLCSHVKGITIVRFRRKASLEKVVAASLAGCSPAEYAVPVLQKILAAFLTRSLGYPLKDEARHPKREAHPEPYSCCGWGSVIGGKLESARYLHHRISRRAPHHPDAPCSRSVLIAAGCHNGLIGYVLAVRLHRSACDRVGWRVRRRLLRVGVDAAEPHISGGRGLCWQHVILGQLFLCSHGTEKKWA